MQTFTIFLFLFSFCSTSRALDSLSPSQSISDGGGTLVSPGGMFELGFCSIGNSSRYLAIWFKKFSNGTVVWVANREAAITNSTGVLQLNQNGVLALLNQENRTMWSSNTSRIAQKPVALLLDSGNLVVRDQSDPDPDNYLWQSFHHPDHSFLPGMKIGKLAGDIEVQLNSWKSLDNPSKGTIAYEQDPSGLQMVVTKNSQFSARSGPWLGNTFSGMPYLRPNPIFNYSFIFNDQESYYTFELVDKSVFTRVILNENGVMDRYAWIERINEWNLISSAPADNCDTYALCGPHGSCDISNSPVCWCLEGFVPRLENDWNSADWKGGCVRRTPLDCAKGDGFIKYPNVKLPDMLNFLMNSSMNLEECRIKCLQNCSCMAYSNSDSRGGGSGCFMWFGQLIDIKQYKDDGGQDLYIRMAASEVAAHSQQSTNHKKKVAIIASTVSFTGMFLLALCIGFFIIKRKRTKLQSAQGKWENNNTEEYYSFDNRETDLEVPYYDFSIIASATDNFSTNNMLGEGGFGPVYKGTLKDGQDIAVKRLSKDSRQGLDEFKNEVTCIARLQHRNLVKLLGYCIHHDEKMLIYEYMPNKSLDCYVFDETQSNLLDWPMRLRIINGISRGLLYLHQDSRLRIIHRDLKLSNILLDHEMNPKISDFGMARIFGGNETEANTKRVVGTYGYMSPEYAIDGLFSIKSDVFSFGVLVLEIISGYKNRGFSHPDHHLNLLGHAWKLFKEGRYMELIDGLTTETCNLSEVSRTIHVGLLCVQHNPEDRPNMSSVVLMLSGDGILPEPKEPGFYHERKLFDAESCSSKHESCSVNEVTITMIDVR